MNDLYGDGPEVGMTGAASYEPAPVDWPARFRAAADVVAAYSPHLPVTAQHFDDIADRLESGLLPPHVVEAIGRELGGGS